MGAVAVTSPKKASDLKISNRMIETPQMRNFQGNPDLVSEFEYLHRLGHKRQNTEKSRRFLKI
jgi:hypothetical protein